MQFSRVLTLGISAAAVAGTVALAGSHSTPEGQAINARKAHMQLNSFNLGVLGAMAKGEVEFDAAVAQAAAGNLAALAAMNQMRYWLPGTSNAEAENTRALPAIWEAGSEVGAKVGALAEATQAMAAAAGTLEGVQANIGAVGGACGACHEAYRAPQ